MVQFRIVRSFDRPCIDQDFRPLGSRDRNLKNIRAGHKTPTEIARLLKIHRATVSRIVSQARAGVSRGGKFLSGIQPLAT